jgi:hypothetical protein
VADQDETGVVDFYLENYHEFEGQAQHDAWASGIGEPFDFTGNSYLEEWIRPLREMTPLIWSASTNALRKPGDRLRGVGASGRL